MQEKKAVSLIVLVITIIVMIVLAGTIILSLNNSGIIEKANEAVEKNNVKQVETLAQLAWSEAYLEGKTEVKDVQQRVETALATNGVDLNKYLIVANKTGVEVQAFDKTAWEHAYTYTRATDKWSERIEKTDEETLTGDIIVKFYKTDEIVTPSGEGISKVMGVPITYNPGNAYKMVIEGNGDMGILGTQDMSTFYAWQLEHSAYLMGMGPACVTPYITEVIIEDGVTNIGDGAFAFASSLRRIIKGNDIKEIGYSAFQYCESLESIVIPSNVEIIGELAFEYCSNLNNVTIPKSVKTMKKAFYHSNASNVILEQGTTAICSMAFMGSALKNITIPSSVTKIEAYAFEQCHNLEEIHIPDSVKEIGAGAFYLCRYLKEITLPSGLKTIEEYLFDDCSNLTDIVIPNTVTNIKKYAFFGCEKLTTITIPVSVTSIESAFHWQDVLTTVNYTGTEQDWNKISPNYIESSLENVTINYNYKAK